MYDRALAQALVLQFLRCSHAGESHRGGRSTATEDFPGSLVEDVALEKIESLVQNMADTSGGDATSTPSLISTGVNASGGTASPNVSVES